MNYITILKIVKIVKVKILVLYVKIISLLLTEIKQYVLTKKI